MSEAELHGDHYKSMFADWDSRSSVRSRPRRMFDEVEDGMALFSAALAPCSAHPLLVERGRAVVDEFLVRRLYLYLDFTTILEQQYVNPTLMRIGQRRLGVRFGDRMRLDAFRIYCDEAYHALFSEDLRHQVEVATRTPALPPVQPRFVSTIRDAMWRTPGDMRGLVELCFAIVSETLISGVLSGIPRDTSVVSAVRESIADHAVDERKHHAYFTRVMEEFWPQLSLVEQRALGPLFADFIIAFLSPDLRAQGAILRGMSVDAVTVRQILVESHPAGDVTAGIRDASRATIRLLERLGVFGDAYVQDYFVRCGLLGDASGRKVLNEPVLYPDVEAWLPSVA